jgi:hypothetical protein
VWLPGKANSAKAGRGVAREGDKRFTQQDTEEVESAVAITAKLRRTRDSTFKPCRRSLRLGIRQLRVKNLGSNVGELVMWVRKGDS